MFEGIQESRQGKAASNNVAARKRKDKSEEFWGIFDVAIGGIFEASSNFIFNFIIMR